MKKHTMLFEDFTKENSINEAKIKTIEIKNGLRLIKKPFFGNEESICSVEMRKNKKDLKNLEGYSIAVWINQPQTRFYIGVKEDIYEATLDLIFKLLLKYSNYKADYLKLNIYDNAIKAEFGGEYYNFEEYIRRNLDKIQSNVDGFFEMNELVSIKVPSFLIDDIYITSKEYAILSGIIKYMNK